MGTQEQIKELFGQLNPEEQKSVLKKLGIIYKQTGQKAVAAVTQCAYCSSELFVKNGHRNRIQRYKCKSCKKTFTTTTGTCHHNLHKPEKFEEYKQLMSKHYYPLKEIADKVGISIQTAFDWRHKILSGLKKDDSKFSGITEVDDIWFLYSQKGRKGLKYSRKRGGSTRQGDNNFQTKLLITADRNSTTDLSVVRIGRLRKEDMDNIIGDMFSEDCTLVSDKHRSISSFAKSRKLPHRSFKSTEHSAGGDYHIQHVNNMASRLKSTVNYQLRGVSTKYLQNYANWFSFKERNKSSNDLYSGLNNELNLYAQDGWYVFTNMEKTYKRFINKCSVRTYRCPVKRKWKTSGARAELLATAG